MLTLLNADKIAALANVLNECRDIPGDLAELGVYRGGVAKLMAERVPGKIVRLFDTFTGIPGELVNDIDYHEPGEFRCGLREVRGSLGNLPNVRFHPGTFPATAKGDAFAFVHLDADLYQSTLDGLKYFWPRLSIGGAIVIDDWRWEYCEGVTKAANEFFIERTDFRFDERTPNQLIAWKLCQ